MSLEDFNELIEVGMVESKTHFFGLLFFVFLEFQDAIDGVLSDLVDNALGQGLGCLVVLAHVK